jgi:hypothetical protein
VVDLVRHAVRLTTYQGLLCMASLKGGTYKLDTNGNGGKIYTNLGRTRDEVACPDGSLVGDERPQTSGHRCGLLRGVIG